MPQDRFFIGPYQTGLETDVRPWLIPDEAFANLQNAYVYKGRVRKRFGSRTMAFGKASGLAQLYTRLRVQLGVTAAGGNFAGVLPAALFTVGKIGQLFSINDEIFTIYQSGNMLKTGATTTATFDTATGAYNFVNSSGGAAGTPVFFYPALPVMGLETYDQTSISDEQLIAFDTRYAYLFTGGAWSRLGTAQWSGGDADFFWSTNYRGIDSDDYLLFVSNYIASDQIKYWDGTTWAEISPVVNPQSRLKTARIIVPFKDRLVAFNTIENTEGTNIGTTAATTGNFTLTPFVATVGSQFLIEKTVFTVTSVAPGAQPMTVTAFDSGVPSTGTYDSTTNTVAITGNNQNPLTAVIFFPNGAGSLRSYRNRCRFSQNGSPLEGNAWLEYPGKGAYLDAPTKEAIITCEFLRDRLIVYFERSTWELVYTGNEILPFRWQQINTELGAESTFSVVSFDRFVFGVGNVGIHTCNGANVERIDQKILEEVFAISNSDNGPTRVQGVRDYQALQVYWAFPSITRANDPGAAKFPYPDKVLVYNYETGAWGLNDDTITSFGYYQDDNDVTWASSDLTWEEYVDAWNTGSLQQRFRSIVMGNQQGWVNILDVNISRNAPSLSVTNVNTTTNVMTVIEHNLSQGDYISLENMNGLTLGRSSDPASTDNVIYQIESVTSTTIKPFDITFTGTYLGGGTVAKVTPHDILTKQYNFYLKDGRNVSVSRIDLQLEKTINGSTSVDYFVSSSGFSLLDAGEASGATIDLSIIQTSPYTDFPIENTQTRVWRSIYPQLNGSFVQLRLFQSYEEIIDFENSTSDFELHSMIFNATPTSARLQ